MSTDLPTTSSVILFKATQPSRLAWQTAALRNVDLLRVKRALRVCFSGGTHKARVGWGRGGSHFTKKGGLYEMVRLFSSTCTPIMLKLCNSQCDRRCSCNNTPVLGWSRKDIKRLAKAIDAAKPVGRRPKSESEREPLGQAKATVPAPAREIEVIDLTGDDE